LFAVPVKLLVMTTLVALIVAALLELSMFIDPILFHVLQKKKRKGCVQSQKYARCRNRDKN